MPLVAAPTSAMMGRVRGDDLHGPLFEVVLQSVGASAEHLRPLLGGMVNQTYRASRLIGGDVVLRFPIDRLGENEFPVEYWATCQAGKAGIPIAQPVIHGVYCDVPFMVSEFVEADPRPTENPWKWLGRYARTIGLIDLREAPPSLYSRFGPDLEHAWSAHLRYNLEALGGDDRLHRDGAYSSRTDLFRRLHSLTIDRYEFGLAHGDLAPRNLISRGSDAPPVLIDWGAAETGPTPWTDARRVFEWAFVDQSISPADYEQFVAGAGLATTEDRHTLASMTALHLLDATRWALDKRPDLYDDYVRRCRMGLDRLYKTYSASRTITACR